MKFSTIKILVVRFIIASGVCFLLANCGNKSALFLETPETIKKTETEKSNSENDSVKTQEKEQVTNGVKKP